MASCRLALLVLPLSLLAGCRFQTNDVRLDFIKTAKVYRALRTVQRVARTPELDTSQFSAADHTNVGVVLEERGMLLAALQQYQSAMAKDPMLVQPRVNIGNVLRRLGQWKPALEAYQAALRMEPDNFEAANNSADLCAEQSFRMWEARAALERALPDSQPQRAYGLETLGWLSSQQGRQAEALALLKQAIESAPDDAKFMALAHFHLGLALHRSGDTEQALLMLEKASSFNPEPELADRIEFTAGLLQKHALK